MPCRYDDGPTTVTVRDPEQDKEIARLRKDLDLVTDALCGLMNQIEGKCDILASSDGEKSVRTNDPLYLSVELQQWWKSHKKADKIRRAAEDAKRQKEIAALEKQHKELADKIAELKKK
jgi:hypothetical protein